MLKPQQLATTRGDFLGRPIMPPKLHQQVVAGDSLDQRPLQRLEGVEAYLDRILVQRLHRLVSE